MDPLLQATMVERFMKMAELAHLMHKQPWNFGTRERFSSREIQLIETVGARTGLSVSALARSLEVTKGAVSQTLKRLEARGLTTKEPDPANSSRAIVGLTTKGKKIFVAHREWHRVHDGGFLDFLDSLDEAQVLFVQELVTRITDFLQNRLMTEE